MAKELKYTVASKFYQNKFTHSWQRQGWINFLNLEKTDALTLSSTFHGMQKAPSTVAFCVNNLDEQRDKLTKNFMAAYDYLSQTGNYIMPPYQKIENDIKNVMYDLIDKKEESEAKKKSDEMWLDFVKKIQDPKIQEVIKSMGQFNLANDAYGWKISYLNIMRVLAKKPDATFVSTRTKWERKYGREVKPGATKLVLLVPIKKEALSKDVIDQTMKRFGYADNTDFNSLSKQQKEAIYNTSSKRDATFFKEMAYYDVSDTELIDPNGPDVWAEEVGYDNNLTRHLNKAAMDQASQNVPKEELDKLYNSENGNVEILAKALERGIKRVFPSVRTSLPKTQNEAAYESCYKDMIARLADYLMEDMGKVVKKENRQEGVKIAVVIVLCLTRVCAADVAKSLKNNELTEASYFELRNIINNIIELINSNGKETNESVKKTIMEKFKTLNSVDELLGMMGMDKKDVMKDDDNYAFESREEEKEAITENFKNMMKRINEADELKREWRED